MIDNLDPQHILWEVAEQDRTPEQTEVLKKLNGKNGSDKLLVDVDLLKDRRCSETLDYVVPKPFMLRADDELLLREGAAILAIGGGQKSAKTDLCVHLFAQAVSSHIQTFINRTNFWMTPNTAQKWCGYFDLEMPKENTHEKIYQRALKRSGYQQMPNYAEVIYLRGMSLRDRMRAIENECEAQAIKHGGIYCLFIDPLTKLLKDAATDGVEAQQVTEWLEKLTERYQCPAFVVIHLNAGDSQGNKLRGHIGSEMHRVADSIVICRKASAMIEVAVVEARNAPSGEVDLYAWDDQRGGFTFTGSGSATGGKAKRGIDIDVLIQSLQSIAGVKMTYTEFCQEVSEAAGCALQTAKSKVLPRLLQVVPDLKRDGKYMMPKIGGQND